MEQEEKKSLPHAQRTQTQAKRNANTCTRIPKMDWKWMEKKHLNRFGFGKWIDAAPSAHDRCKWDGKCNEINNYHKRYRRYWRIGKKEQSWCGDTVCRHCRKKFCVRVFRMLMAPYVVHTIFVRPPIWISILKFSWKCVRGVVRLPANTFAFNNIRNFLLYSFAPSRILY